MLFSTALRASVVFIVLLLVLYTRLARGAALKAIVLHHVIRRVRYPIYTIQHVTRVTAEYTAQYHTRYSYLSKTRIQIRDIQLQFQTRTKV